MEFWDVYDENRKPIGKLHTRGVPMKKGEYHLTVFVWVFNSNHEVLLTKRAPEKRAYPNLWALTGGAVQAGESSLQAVQRELLEETGIFAPQEDFLQIETFLRKDCFCDVYFLRKDVPVSEMVMQPGETIAAMWVGRSEFEKMARNKLIARPDIKRYYELCEKLVNFLK